MVTVSGKCRVFVVGKGPDLVIHLTKKVKWKQEN